MGTDIILFFTYLSFIYINEKRNHTIQTPDTGWWKHLRWFSVWQRLPVWEDGQLHRKELTPCVHVPPFRQGLLAHSLMSTSQFCPGMEQNIHKILYMWYWRIPMHYWEWFSMLYIHLISFLWRITKNFMCQILLVYTFTSHNSVIYMAHSPLTSVAWDTAAGVSICILGASAPIEARLVVAPSGGCPMGAPTTCAMDGNAPIWPYAWSLVALWTHTLVVCWWHFCEKITLWNLSYSVSKWKTTQENDKDACCKYRKYLPKLMQQ